VNEPSFREELGRIRENERRARRILGVGPGAGPAEVKRAFWTQALRFHPDKNPGDEEALRAFRNVLRAYECLKGKAPLPPGKDGEEQPRVGKYADNEWGYFCHWREAYMDDFLGRGEKK